VCVNSIFDINTACQLFCILSVLCIFHCEYRNTVSSFSQPGILHLSSWKLCRFNGTKQTEATRQCEM